MGSKEARNGGDPRWDSPGPEQAGLTPREPMQRRKLSTLSTLSTEKCLESTGWRQRMDGQKDSLLLKGTSPWREKRLNDSPSFDGTEPSVTETHQRADG